MDLRDSLAFLKRLQHVLLDAEDNTNLISLLLPKILQEVSSFGLTYEIIGSVFVDNDLKIKQSFFVPTNQNMFNPESLFVKNNAWEKELLWGNLVVSAEKNGTIVLYPILNNRKLIGAAIFVTSREKAKINSDELEIIGVLVNLIGIAFKLQDTQNSLTTITQEVYKMNAKLHELDKLKDDFVSVASHELRTPMTAIRSYAWMALNRPDIPLTPKLQKYLSRTLVSTERLINLVNDMLNVSRIEAGRIEINPKAFDILKLVKDVTEEVKIKADEKKLNISALEHPLPQVFADVDKIHEVLLNLIGNSIKFCFPSGTILISFFVNENMIEVSIKDNGPGITKDDLAKLFHKFSRLDNSYTAVSTSGGTGLGLFISKSLVELMHGKISVQSEGLNKGATFSFSLPVATKEILSEAEKYHIAPKNGEVKPLEPVAV